MDNNSEVVYLYLDDIIPNRFQPREVFDEQALKELAVSIKEHGVIQPIIVRQVDNKYEIIAGERRYKASTMAGLTKIPAIVKNLDDKESSKVALIENLQRRDLTPIEEARTYQKILELEDEMTQEELAATMGKTQSSVSNKLRLLALPDEVQDALLNEKISERHARSLLNIEDSNEQVKMLNRIIEEKLTVRELDKIIKGEKEETVGSVADLESAESSSPSEPQIGANGNEESAESNEETSEDSNEGTEEGEESGESENAPTDSDNSEEEQSDSEDDVNINALIRDISDDSGDSSSGGNSAIGTGIENMDLSKIANPFDKPETDEPKDEPVEESKPEETAENSNVSSTIETPKLNIPNLNLDLKGIDTAPLEEKKEETPSATPSAAAPSGEGGYLKAVEDFKKLVEPYKSSGVVKDSKEFEFGNYVTLTIRINKK